MAGFVFNGGSEGLQNNSIVWATDVIKVRPLTAASEAAVNKDATTMTGLGTTGYDVTVGGKTRTKNTTDDRIEYRFANPSFPSVAGAVGVVNHFLVFKFVTTDADSIPIAKVQMSAVTPNGGNIDVTIDAAGAFYTQQ